MVPFWPQSPRKHNPAVANSVADNTNRHCHLSFETLEPRQMLAADMAEIFGVVRTDLQGDGIASNDTVVAGATATLYRDGNNQAFDDGSIDDVVVASVTTHAEGVYRFDQVGAGRYFVKITLPPHLQFADGEDVRQVTISDNEGDGINGPVIDGFTTDQDVEATPPLPSSDPSQLLDSSVLGGQRDLYVELTEGTDRRAGVSLVSGDGLMRLASDAAVTGNAKIVWDGIDDSALGVNAIGLRGNGLVGIDLTHSGGNTMIGISLTSGADHPNSRIAMRIYTDADNWSEFATTVPESPKGLATGQAIFRFNDIPNAQGGSGADFTNVGALELTFEGVSAVDGQVALVGLVGRANKETDFTASPRLSLGDRLWADIDDDDLFEPNEVGIAGVKLNLYEDKDGNNKYTSGVDTLLGMDTTDSSGRYLFTDLFPGKYAVQIDPTNFQTQGPLFGLQSSSGGAQASDPDDNLNNDDNGTPLDSAGVVSQAIMLTGDSEPTNDGDTDPNSNLTVDFGFFGFDLALDKAVQQMTVAPAGTIDYTIKVDNLGPSAAENTTFEDILPDGVTFVSGTTSLNNVGVNHAEGVVTADLGTMQPGATVFVTIIATVDSNASGTLVNTAMVSAPKEVNLSNNTDTVSNPLSPRIDLDIDKRDSRDPVEPGSTFSYTLDVVNIGPSNATGVVITDNLPDGVTYVSSSRTPTTNTGDQLTFDVGNLARDASTSVTIEVRVDTNIAGELINHSVVRGNEQETTLLNNEDTERTLVEVDPANIAGSVFVDRNDDGIFDPDERPLSDVVVDLKGTDLTGSFVFQTTTTATDGSYFFGNLPPGNYQVIENQPIGYRDGKDRVGDKGGVHGLAPGPLLIPNDVEPAKYQDLVFDIGLESGDVGLNYDFGELAVSVSKIDFIGSANW